MVPLLFSIRLLPGATIANDFSHPFSLPFAIGAASVLDVTMALGNTIAFPYAFVSPWISFSSARNKL